MFALRIRQVIDTHMLTFLTPTPAESIARRTSELFAAYRLDIHRRTDRLLIKFNVIAPQRAIA